MSVINTGKILWLQASDAVRDEANKLSYMSSENDELLDMDFVGEHYVENKNVATEKLIELISEAQEKDADYLLLFK